MSRIMSLSSLVFAVIFLTAVNAQAEYAFGGATKPGCQELPVAVARPVAPVVRVAFPSVPPTVARPVTATRYAATKPALSRGNPQTSTFFNLSQALSHSQEFQSLHSGYVPRQPAPSSTAKTVAPSKNISSKNISALFRSLK